MAIGTRRLLWWLAAPLIPLSACGEGNGDTVGSDVALGERTVVAVSAAVPPEVATSLPPGISLEMINEGKAVYTRGCIACHGSNGEGTQLGPSLQDTVWIHSAGDAGAIMEVIRAGVAEPREFPVPMPPEGGIAINDAEMRALAAYVSVLPNGVR